MPTFLDIGVLDLLGHLYIFGFGACVGSFLNVCILRIPLDISVIHPSSRCSCGIAIPIYHNIPILSWFILLGKASCCNQRYSFRYPFVEFLTAAFFTIQWSLFSAPLIYVSFIFTFILIVVTFIDLDHLIIPDRFSIGGAILGILLSFCIPEMHAVLEPGIQGQFVSAFKALIGVLVGTGICYWLRALFEILLGKEAMGEGDVKFLGCVGAFCGWQGTLFSLFGGAFIGLVCILPILAINRILGKRDHDPMIPFGPMLAFGAWLQFHFLRDWTNNYFENIYQIVVLN